MGRAGGRPLRVAIVIARLEGGAGLLALRGAQVLDRARYTPTIIAGSGQPLMTEAARSGIEVIVEPDLKRPIDPGTDLRALASVRRQFTARRFDVVHTHAAKGGVIGRVAARLAGVPRIVHTYHGFPFHQFQAWPRRTAFLLIERALGQITDHALCVGVEVAAEAVRRELITPERVRAVGVLVDGPQRASAWQSAGTPEARRRARAELGIPPGATAVGMVGRLTYQKAPEDFVAALALLSRPGVLGVWIGDGELAGRMSGLGGALGDGRLILAGDRDDVLDLLPALDIFALSSRYEGLPTVVVEAMLCGVPVIATAVNAVPDLVVPGETGLLVPPQRPAKLAAAIDYLLDRPGLAARFGANGRRRVAGRYRAADLAAALAEAYQPDLPG